MLERLISQHPGMLQHAARHLASPEHRRTVAPRRNAEANVSIYDHAFAENMERVVLKDIDQSHAYSLQEWKHRGLWERCRELYSTLFSNAY